MGYTICNKCGSDKCYISSHVHDNTYMIQCRNCMHTFHDTVQATGVNGEPHKTTYLLHINQDTCLRCDSGHIWKTTTYKETGKTRVECQDCNYAWYCDTDFASTFTSRATQECLHCGNHFKGRTKLYCSEECLRSSRLKRSRAYIKTRNTNE